MKRADLKTDVVYYAATKYERRQGHPGSKVTVTDLRARDQYGRLNARGRYVKVMKTPIKASWWSDQDYTGEPYTGDVMASDILGPYEEVWPEQAKIIQARSDAEEARRVERRTRDRLADDLAVYFDLKPDVVSSSFGSDTLLIHAGLVAALLSAVKGRVPVDVPLELLVHHNES